MESVISTEMMETVSDEEMTETVETSETIEKEEVNTEYAIDMENEISTEISYSETMQETYQNDAVVSDDTIPVAFIFVLGVIAGLLLFNQFSRGWKL